MAGILINIDSDIEKLRRLKAEIEKVKSALKSIDVNIKVDMAADLEAKLKSLTSSYNAIISKVAEAEAKIMESEARIKKFTDSITDAQRKITQTAGMNTGTGTSASDMSAVDNAQTASVDAQAKAYAELADEIDKVIGTREQNIRKLVEEQNAVKYLQKQIANIYKNPKETTGTGKNERQILSESQVRLLGIYNKHLLEHKVALSQVQQVLMNEQKLYDASESSMQRLSQELGRMRIAYRKMSDEQKASPFGKELLASIEQADAKIKGLDASIGNYQRNVGNYKSGFNGLNMSVQQIVRELPSATMGLNMFFLAISNNLPILTDEIKRAKAANDELKASGQKGVPVWKQLVSSLFSWQSAMMVGITLLSMYGKEFTKFVSGLFKTREEIGLTEEAIKRIADATTSLNAELSKESSEIDKLFGKLAKARKGTGEYDEAKTAILNKYGKYLEGLSDEIRSLNDVAAAYDAVTIAANKSAKARALGRAKEQAENSYSDSIKELASDLIGEFTGANVKGTVTELSEQEAARLTQKIISDLMDNGALSEDSLKSLREIGTIRTDKGTYSGTGAGELNDLIDKTKEYRHELMIANAAFGEFESQFENMSTDELDKALNTLDKIEDILNKSGKGAKFTNKATGLELDITNIRDLFHYREQIQAILNKRNSEVQDVIDGGIVVTGNTADYKRNKQEKTDAERKQKEIEDARLKAQEELDKLLLDLQKRNQSDEIALMKDGRKKRLAEINADYEARKAEIAAKAAELAELNRKAGITDVDFNGLTIQQGKDIAKANLLNDRNRTASEVDMLLEERRAMDEYLKEYGSFMEKREAITNEYNEKIAEAGGKDTWQGKALQKEMEKALSELDFSEFKKSIDFTDVFGNLGELTSGALSDLKDKLSEYINKAASKLRPEDLKELQDAFAKIEFEEIDRNPFAGLASSMDDYRTAQDAVEKAQQELDTVLKGGVVITGQYMDENQKLHNILLTQEQAEKNLAKAQSDRQKSLEKVNATINNIGQKGSAVVNSGQQIVGMLENFGVEVPEVVSTTLDGIGQIMQGLASIDITKPFSLITGSISVITGIGNTIAGWFGAGDSKHEKQIQRLQDQIDALDKSYDRLGKSIEKAYSTDASELIEQQNKMLEQQKILIQQQMEEEEAKKHTDEEKMQEYRDRLEEIEDLQNDNKEKAIEAIAGTDVMSAIDEFAQAYADAWANGTDAATASTKAVKSLIQGALLEFLKKQLSPTVEKFVTKLSEYMADGVLSPWEKAQLDQFKKEMDDMAANYYDQTADYWKEDSAEQQSASSRAFGTEMTQEQGAEISGRLTAMTESNIRLESVGQQQFIAITDIKGSMAGIATQLPMIYNVADESRRILADSYLELQSIRENTGAIVKPIKDIKTSITNIERKITNL